MRNLLIVSVFSLSACTMSTEFISTSGGLVECAGYMEEYVYLDHAVDFPPTMSKQDADRACKRLGAQKILAANR